MIALIIHSRNKSNSKQASKFFDYMLYDETMQENTLNECICLSNKNEIEKYRNESYFESLKMLYAQRTENETQQEKPQKFILYGKDFKKMSTGLSKFFTYQIIFTLIMGGVIGGFGSLVGTRTPKNFY